ncbi:MAG: DinB family protein [Vicinamibacteria bacterium]
MFRRIADFATAWEHESASTLKILRGLDDASLGQAVSSDHRTLGRLAWHVTTTLGEMLDRTGLKITGPAHDAPPPTSAAAIADAYEAAARAVAEQVTGGWNDAALEATDDMYGEKWPRGVTLMALVCHQAHHRGQMTVLMRQAGLKVPGVYGPAREEWGAYGMPAPEV